MKFFYIVALFFTLCSSCSSDTALDEYFLELVPIESMDLPSEFIVNSTHSIPVYYKNPTNCNVFDSFYFEKNENIRTIAIQTLKVVKQNCEANNQTPIEVMLRFKPTELGMITFKIWKGKTSSGIDIYDEIEIPVIE